jgi:hypothetical protein
LNIIIASKRDFILTYYDKIFRTTTKAIVHFQGKGIDKIDVKTIRKYHDIPSSERSTISFISRSLNELTAKGFLKTLNNSTPKKYLILKDLKEEFKL